MFGSIKFVCIINTCRRIISERSSVHNINGRFYSWKANGTGKQVTPDHKQESDEQADVHQRTPLYDFHVNNNGKMIPFGGYLLPVYYANLSVGQSHVHTRKYASIFDVSHMQQTYVMGQHAIECIETLCPANINGLKIGTGTLTVFTNSNGGILDDLIVTKIAPTQLYVVTNASRKLHDINLMRAAVQQFQANGKDVSIEFMNSTEQALIALQGPQSFNILQELCSTIQFSNLFFMNSIDGTVAGIPQCRITRCGYTGEDGFEISVRGDRTTDLVEAMLQCKTGNAELAGLGARDSLRLEAGLCLYGTDINEHTTPIEAGLAWTIAKRRRTELNFPGATTIGDQLKNGTKTRRIGIRMEKGPPARHGISIYGIAESGATELNAIGHITSGCPSPSLGGNIAMGYVNHPDYRQIGAKIQLNIRGRYYDASVVKLPFIQSKYFLAPK